MNGLWADGWFYISSLGLLVSGVLFFFFLGQYRLAADAADQTQVVAEPEFPPSAVNPVYSHEEKSPSAQVFSAVSEAPVERPKPEPVAAPEPAPSTPRRENTTGGISPAVVYLQNIKTQLEGLHGQVAELSKRVESVTGRDEALIERLGELARAVDDLRAASPAESAPKRPRKSAAEKPVEKPEEKPEQSEPVAASAPAVEAAPVAVETAFKEEAPAEMKLELGAAPASQVVKADVPAPEKTVYIEPEVAPKASDPLPEKEKEGAAEPEKPSRRGPVWPV